MKIKALFLAIILAFATLFSSCATPQTTNNEYYGGESMNAEILSSIAESIFSESEIEESSTSTKTTVNSATTEEITTEKREHDGVYYWTESGGVYHLWSDCGHLKNSKDVKSGSVDEAISDGKEKLCSSCEKKS